MEADEKGVDSLYVDCETPEFAPVPPTSPRGPATRARAVPAAERQTPGIHLAPVLDRLKLKPRSFRAATKGASIARTGAGRVYATG